MKEPSATLEFEQRFVVLPQWVLFADETRRGSSGLSDKAVRLYAVLQSYANNDTGQAMPKRRTLAAGLNCSIKTVDRALEELVKFGAIDKIRRRDDAGDWDSNEYFVRARPELTLWSGTSPVTRGGVTDVPTRGVTDDATVASPVTTQELDPIELDLNNYNESQSLVTIADDVLRKWGELSGTPITKAYRRKWHSTAREFLEAAPPELAARVPGFLDYAVREGCRTPAGWASFATTYTRHLRLAGLEPFASTVHSRGDEWIGSHADGEIAAEGDVREALGMRDGETGREFLERSARET